ncbi:MAG: hypothetical protein ABQ298_13475 [Puniceicoccaceae bacterium]
MNHTTITYEDLNAMLSVIAYLHGKICEGSMVLGENFDLISEDLIAEIGAFVDVESSHLQPCRLQPAA